MSGKRGIAQLLVLWALVLLGTLALGFSLSMRTEAQAARHGVDDARAYFQARTGVMRTVSLLSTLPADNVMRMEITGEEGDASYEVRVESESGKVDINFVDEDILYGILRKGGLPDDEAESVRDAILDWKDPDDTPRPRGAEAPDYAQLPEPVLPRNGKIRSVGELQHVRGVSPEFYRRFLSKVFTAHGNARHVNFLFAPQIVLQALPGVSPEAAAQIVARRLEEPPPSTMEFLSILGSEIAPKERGLVFSGGPSSNTYAIAATGRAGTAVTHTVLCLVEISGGGKKGIRVLGWLDHAPREVGG